MLGGRIFDEIDAVLYVTSSDMIWSAVEQGRGDKGAMCRSDN